MTGDDSHDADKAKTSNPSQQISPQTSQLPHTVSSIKLLILKKGEYDIWAIKMEHYLCHTDYPIWKMIQNGNGTVSVTTDTNGMIKVLPSKTVEEVVARERKRKAKTTLLMALPEVYLAKLHKMANAKEMWKAIKSRFGLHKGYDRFQTLMSQLEIHGAGVSQNDANQKFLRVIERDVKGTTPSSSNIQNVAFVSADNTSSTNDVSIAYSVSSPSVLKSQKEGSASYTDEVIHSFFANQSSSPQLDCDDLEQINDDDLEEMDLKWQVAMISIRIKKFHKKTGRKLQFDTRDTVGFDKTKVECFNFYKIREAVDWSGHVKEDTQNFALMAYSSSNSGSDNEVQFCSKTYAESYARLKKLYDEQRDKLECDLENTHFNDRYAEGMHAVPPPMTGNYIPSGPDVEIDYSQFTYGLKQTSADESDSKPVEFTSCDSDSSVEIITSMLAPIEDAPKYDPYKDLKDKGIVDSGCSRHMTRDKAHLVDYQEFKGSSVAFERSNGRITGKGTIKASRLDFEDVYYMEELKHYNLFSVSQMCDKKKKASIDESKKWHRRLGHVNFKKLNKLVKGNLVRGLPSKIFENDHTCVACQKGKQHKASWDTIGKNEKPVSPVEQIFQEELEKLKRQEKEANVAVRKEGTHETLNINTNNTNPLNTVSAPVNAVGPSRALNDDEPLYHDDLLMPHLEDIYASPSAGIFTDLSYDAEGMVTDFNNLETTVTVSPTPTTRIHTIHPKTQILRDPLSAVQTRSKVHKNSEAHALVWILVDLPFGKKAIGTKWVYRNKKDERGVVVRNKAHLVAQGHRQEERIDYDEVFAPMARIEAIRIFLAFASYIGFIVYQMDVKSSFMYGTIDEEVYVIQPPGFVDPKFSNKVYKVIKALYGLHQAPKAWYATLSTFLERSGYRRGAIDKTLFIKQDKKDIMLVQVYVKQKEDGIFISQDKYVAEILKFFDFLSVKTTSTPIETRKPLVKDEEAADVDISGYSQDFTPLSYEEDL
uniref:Uncharacterized protein n=1 Tax=Tanacetum cinerariifolium TaxID=118510 RepID=A0A699I7A7_TANCI|nr:hypothetical protein [Tanacetum cinerariifolium]